MTVQSYYYTLITNQTLPITNSFFFGYSYKLRQFEEDWAMGLLLSIEIVLLSLAFDIFFILSITIQDSPTIWIVGYRNH